MAVPEETIRVAREAVDPTPEGNRDRERWLKALRNGRGHDDLNLDADSDL